MTPVRAAFASFIDYAGLFPPAGLDLEMTIANHARYARSSDRWVLGRCVVPLPRLADVAAMLRASTPARGEWSIAVLIGAHDRVDAVMTAVDGFHAAAACTGVSI